jgi:hypothetical protein
MLGNFSGGGLISLFFCSGLGHHDGLDWLIANGHSKWRSVDLDYPLKGWEQYDCVKNRLQKKRAIKKSSAEINPILEAVKDILGQ